MESPCRSVLRSRSRQILRPPWVHSTINSDTCCCAEARHCCQHLFAKSNSKGRRALPASRSIRSQEWLHPSQPRKQMHEVLPFPKDRRRLRTHVASQRPSVGGQSRKLQQVSPLLVSGRAASSSEVRDDLLSGSLITKSPYSFRIFPSSYTLIRKLISLP